MAKKINTRTLMGQKMLRNLGYPVIKVNVDDAHIDDAIDDALEWMIEHHRNFTKTEYYIYQLTQNDVDNGYIQLPENVTDVVQFLESGSSSTSVGSDTGGFGTQAYQIQSDYNLAYQTDTSSIASSIVEWEIFNTFNETVLKQYTGDSYTQFIFDKDNCTLKPQKTMDVGDMVALECAIQLIDTNIDASTTSNLFGVLHFQQLATAILKQTWGNILSKFVGIQMVGGVTLNGEQIKQEATEEIVKIKEEINDENKMKGLYMIVG